MKNKINKKNSQGFYGFYPSHMSIQIFSRSSKVNHLKKKNQNFVIDLSI